jgi:hypothetical protein
MGEAQLDSLVGIFLERTVEAAESGMVGNLQKSVMVRVQIFEAGSECGTLVE